MSDFIKKGFEIEGLYGVIFKELFRGFRKLITRNDGIASASYASLPMTVSVTHYK